MWVVGLLAVGGGCAYGGYLISREMRNKKEVGTKMSLPEAVEELYKEGGGTDGDGK